MNEQLRRDMVECGLVGRSTSRWEAFLTLRALRREARAQERSLTDSTYVGPPRHQGHLTIPAPARPAPALVRQKQ